MKVNGEQIAAIAQSARSIFLTGRHTYERAIAMAMEDAGLDVEQNKDVRDAVGERYSDVVQGETLVGKLLKELPPEEIKPIRVAVPIVSAMELPPAKPAPTLTISRASGVDKKRWADEEEMGAAEDRREAVGEQIRDEKGKK